jgi:hypothetical protein
MKLTSFLGINNVEPTERLKPGELVSATNVDVTLTGQVRRRSGFALETAGAHSSLFEGTSLALGVASTGSLVNLDGGAVLRAGMGLAPRVWFCELPDGRVVFSNGVAHGIASAAGATDFGIPLPANLGTFGDIAGDLAPGRYRWQLTHVRLADGVEGGPSYAAPVDIVDGGFSLMDVPQLDGHSTNVYLTTANGDAPYFAGNTTTSMFTFIGKNGLLVRPCYTDDMGPPPVGILHAYWRGRVLLAVGGALIATRPQQWELCDPEKDIRMFPGTVSLIQPVEGGIWIGTDKELAFLEGSQFDALVYRHVIKGRVVLGSGVTVDGDQVTRAQGRASGTAMVCIADGMLVAGYNDGGAQRLAEGRYTTAATEVVATFRRERGVPQYLASVIA